MNNVPPPWPLPTKALATDRAGAASVPPPAAAVPPVPFLERAERAADAAAAAVLADVAAADTEDLAVPAPDVASRAEVFDHIVAGYRVGAFTPPARLEMLVMGSQLRPGPSLQLVLPPDDEVAVRQWASHFGLAAPVLDGYLVVLPDWQYRRYEADSDPLTMFYRPPALWRGWFVTVLCHVAEEPASADAGVDATQGAAA